MRAIYTECIVSQSPASVAGSGTIFDEDYIRIRVEDNAAGPFLVISGGMSDEPIDCLPGSFALDKSEIDQFAAICKSMLKQAEAA